MLNIDISYLRGTIRHQHQLSLTAQESAWLSGESGIGKSSLLLALTGLIAVDPRSRIIWQQQEIQDLPTADRPLVMLPQGNSLIGHLPLWQNVAMGHCSGWWFSKQDKQQAIYWLEQVGLADLAGRYPADISGGQAQRTGLARCLWQMQATNRRLLLLDEATSALDGDTHIMIMTLISRLQKMYDWTVIWVAHQPVTCDHHWLMQLADGIVATKNNA